jgi:hypothetical protein
MSQLHPCPACARHVKRSETSCPFCSASIALEGVAARARPTQRMGRAATFAFGAAVATSLAACSGATTPTGTDANTSIDSGVSPLYGGPPDADATDAGTDTGGPGPMYGAPPIDSGVDAGGPAPAYGGPFPGDDAGQEDAGGGGAPLYGAPPPAE